MNRLLKRQLQTVMCLWTEARVVPEHLTRPGPGRCWVNTKRISRCCCGADRGGGGAGAGWEGASSSPSIPSGLPRTLLGSHSSGSSLNSSLEPLWVHDPRLPKGPKDRPPGILALITTSVSQQPWLLGGRQERRSLREARFQAAPDSVAHLVTSWGRLHWKAGRPQMGTDGPAPPTRHAQTPDFPLPTPSTSLFAGELLLSGTAVNRRRRGAPPDQRAPFRSRH